MRAWGYDAYGQCDVPADLTNAVAVAGGYNFSMALTAAGSIRVWGEGPIGYQTNVPAGLTNAIGISGGVSHAIGLRPDGLVQAWGADDVGQCDVPAWLPVVRSIAAGSDHNLVLVDPYSAPPPPPVILGLPFPASQTAVVGSTAAFTAHASGFPPLRYQWFFSQTNAIPGATNQTLRLRDVHLRDSGGYSVAVSNGGGSTNSGQAILNVVTALDIHMVPAINLYGEVGLTYRLDYINAVGPTNDWHALATITLTNNPQLYFDLTAGGQPTRFYRLVQVP